MDEDGFDTFFRQLCNSSVLVVLMLCATFAFLVTTVKSCADLDRTRDENLAKEGLRIVGGKVEKIP